ncbi:MAG: hypothetical protein AAFY11_16390, partial [Cyanobacteria bacterium J06641_5]
RVIAVAANFDGVHRPVTLAFYSQLQQMQPWVKMPLLGIIRLVRGHSYGFTLLRSLSRNAIRAGTTWGLLRTIFPAIVPYYIE